jgi:uncharacterized membrane protein
MHWLRRSFIAGFFVTVPLFISVAAFIWIFGVVDGLTTPFYDRFLGRRVPGLGTLSTALAIVLVGAVATNVIGKRLLQRAEGYLLRVPVFRTIYSLGFLTREFTLDRGTGPQALMAVYVPTNNLYLGDIVLCERDRAMFPDISVEEGIRIFLTGGMALPSRVQSERPGDPSEDLRV